MARELLVAFPDYYKNPVKPQSFEAFCDMFEREDHGPIGLWCLKQIDKLTGEVQREIWRKNVLLDTGGAAYLARTFGVNAPSTMFGQIAATTNCGATNLTTALTNGQTNITSLAVAALPAAIPATTGGVATTVVIGYGTGQTQTVTLSSGAAQGATSISVVSFTANAAYGVGTNVLPQPHYAENPSSLGGTISYSGAYTNPTFTPSGSGPAGRQMVISYTFSTTGSPAASAGAYTEAYVIDTAASTAVSSTGHCAVRVTFMPINVNNTANGLVIVTEKV